MQKKENILLPYRVHSEAGADFILRLKKDLKNLQKRKEKKEIIKLRLIELKEAKLLNIADPCQDKAQLKDLLTDSKKLLSDSQQAAQRVISTRQVVTLGGRDSLGKLDFIPGKITKSGITNAVTQSDKDSARFLFELIDTILFELESQIKIQILELGILRDETVELI